jgi:polyhydroxyalkanoate synthesis regulator phasin
MASKKSDDGGTVNRLAARGEEAVTRLIEELSKNPRVTEAVERAMETKDKIDQSARGALGQFGVAAADELKELRKQIERLERRLAKLETKGEPASNPTAKKSETKKTPTARKSTTTKKAADKAPSPPPGRSIGGGSGRGSSAS